MACSGVGKSKERGRGGKKKIVSAKGGGENKRM